MIVLQMPAMAGKALPGFSLLPGLPTEGQGILNKVELGIGHLDPMPSSAP